MAQLAKDLELSLWRLGSLLRHGFDPRPRNCHMPWVWEKKKLQEDRRGVSGWWRYSWVERKGARRVSFRRFEWNKLVFWERLSKSHCFILMPQLFNQKLTVDGVLLWLSRLRIQHCRCCDFGYCGGGDSVPDPGTSACCKCGPPKKSWLLMEFCYDSAG